ncbi:MAG: tetratricopeptide repeat protein [Vicinamibacterales bacterium]|nr:tetratricopeptide repeat protein [Vicinamibacterales bacterium]
MTRAGRGLTVVALCGLLIPGLASAQDRTRWLVMPFDAPSGAPEVYWMSEGSAVLLTAILDGLGEEVVSRDERLRAFARLQLPATATLSHATTIKVGQLVAATGIVAGSYEVDGDRLRVSARRFDLVRGALTRGPVVERPLAEVFALYDAAARAIAARGSEAPLARGTLPPSPAAFEQYVKGLMAETPAAQVMHLEQALRGGVEFDAARLALWEVHTGEERHAQALEAVAPIGLFGPAADEGRFRAALSRLNLGRHDEAFAGFEALAGDTGAPAALNALGILQLRRGATSPAPAAYYFNRAADAAPSEGDYRFNLGYAYWRAGDAPAAVHWLREAVRVNPADDDAHFVLGAALTAIGATAEAAREVDLARRLSARYEKAGTAVPAGLERLVEHLAVGPARVDAVLTASAQRDQADLAMFHLEAGRRAVDREDDRAAIQELGRALYLQPYEAEAHLLLGRVYLRGGRFADAVDAFKISLWSEETAEARLALADAQLQRREFDEAAAELARAAELDPDHPDLPGLKARLAEARPPG